MNFATYNRAWLDEMRTQKEYILRCGVLAKVDAFRAEQHAYKAPIFQIPLAFDRAEFDALAAAGVALTSAQTKILQHLDRQDSHAELLRRFDFPEAWEWMVNWDALTSGAHTINRIDIVPSNNGYVFCELNPDSSVGGTEIADWLKVYCDGTGWPLAEGMASPQDATVTLLRRALEDKRLERIVVVDWATNRANGFFGFDLLRQHLTRALPGVEIHHVYHDEYRETWLDPREGRRTLVHRGFMYEDMTDEGAFLRRLCDSEATIINTMETVVRSHKSWFAMFHDPAYHGLLSAAELDAISRYVPHTVAVRRDNLDGLLDRKAELVFKLNASYGGAGVMMGADHTADHLRAAIEAKGVELWTAQQGITFDGIDLPSASEFEFTRHNVVLGLFLIDGAASGLMTRASDYSKVVNVASGKGRYTWAIPMTAEEQARHLTAIRRTRT